MTRITKAAETNEPMVDVRPNTIVITEPCHIGWPTAMYLIRQGWAINPDMPPLAFLNTGYVTVTLVRETPDASIAIRAAQIAQEAEQLASELHVRAYLRDVQAAAIVAADTAKKTEAAALLAAEIAAQSAALDALKAAAATAARV